MFQISFETLKSFCDVFECKVETFLFLNIREILKKIQNFIIFVLLSIMSNNGVQTEDEQEAHRKHILL